MGNSQNYGAWAVTTSIVTTPVVNMGPFDGGRVLVPTGETITTLTWYECDTEGGTYVACYDSSGTAVVTTVAAGRSYPIPATLNASRFLKAVGDAAGDLVVILKGLTA